MSPRPRSLRSVLRVPTPDTALPAYVGADHQDDARPVACSDERVLRPGRRVKEVPGSEATLLAFADHGEVADTLTVDPVGAAEVLAGAASAGLDLEEITDGLEREGVRSFCDSYRQLLACIESRLGTLKNAGPSG